ncbi:MAG: nucleotidyltransferase domain-containing protein [Methanobacteriota archaeon]|nr:MAG: nucleotidyltransferase domain-containing protein [Euryarchaeota archaeon]
MDSVLLRHMKICFTLLELNDLVRSLDPLVSTIVLFGSCAEGEDKAESDIDLFIEAMDTDAVKDILKSRQDTISRTLSPIVATPNDTYVMKAKDKTLYASIQQGIPLMGGEHVPSL